MWRTFFNKSRDGAGGGRKEERNKIVDAYMCTTVRRRIGEKRLAEDRRRVIKSWEAAKRDRKQMKQKERKRDSKKEEKHRHHDG